MCSSNLNALVSSRIGTTLQENGRLLKRRLLKLQLLKLQLLKRQLLDGYSSDGYSSDACPEGTDLKGGLNSPSTR